SHCGLREPAEHLTIRPCGARRAAGDRPGCRRPNRDSERRRSGFRHIGFRESQGYYATLHRTQPALRHGSPIVGQSSGPAHSAFAGHGCASLSSVRIGGVMTEQRRGRLKIFMGYAAGVGKTYQMLEEAQELKSKGVDVVIGYFEPHGRPDTIAKAEGLEVIA